MILDYKIAWSFETKNCITRRTAESFLQSELNKNLNNKLKHKNVKNTDIVFYLYYVEGHTVSYIWHEQR